MNAGAVLGVGAVPRPVSWLLLFPAGSKRVSELAPGFWGQAPGAVHQLAGGRRRIGSVRREKLTSIEESAQPMRDRFCNPFHHHVRGADFAPDDAGNAGGC